MSGRTLTDDIRELMAVGHTLETATELAIEDRKTITTRRPPQATTTTATTTRTGRIIYYSIYDAMFVFCVVIVMFVIIPCFYSSSGQAARTSYRAVTRTRNICMLKRKKILLFYSGWLVRRIF